MEAAVRIEPVSLALGARVHGVDLSREITEETWARIKAAFAQHSVLIFPAQEITIDQQKAFGRRFGELLVHEHLLPFTVAGHPECMALHNNAQKPPGLNEWHTDNSGWPEPPRATILHAKIVTDLGGDTLFSNMYLAYEALSRPMQALLTGLSAVHDVRKAFGADYANLQRSLRKSGIDPVESFRHREPVVHPLVRTHPETRRRALYLSAPYVTHIEGLSRSESRAILDLLYRHIETSEFIYRHRWTKGDLVIWDNRCTQHLAVADYYPQERLMHRMNVAGEKPQLDPEA
ncbi:TauD/TfdA dioxygenase family protein [Chondromyces apiculatus]|uniref:Alpha-ketoglutarate-dependent taurine dioxygenase n=1 Tax=Chondromyces apiculatus DSM 436 TaxID=1192034 RepID=A0A017TA74_9BACT|nr:TauD/TfdA family dioxygenase [Chondromyces apiculatus]EYF05511.1 Alpha-ketoglutarate-dependent taurine dioxygenase [Chondromyces apiculatus DSM 436]